MDPADPAHDAGAPLTVAVLAGLLLAAGGGHRMGGPKALLRDPDGRPRLVRAVETLHEGGCRTVTVVLGAGAQEAAEILSEAGADLAAEPAVVVAEDWAEGMSASLRSGLAALPPADAAVVTLVDLPDVGPEAVRRLAQGTTTEALARATYAGRPGHPVLLGRDHWDAVAASTTGDRGARDYLDRHGAVEVPCDDLATGRDLDRPEDLTESPSLDR